MDLKSPQEIAHEIIVRNARAVDGEDVLMLRDEIAQAIQFERDLLAMRVQVLEPRAGDVLFVSCPDHLSEQSIAHVQHAFGQVLPGIKIILLEKRLQLDCVVRPEAANVPA